MYTTCPNCALNLAVTAADLRIGQGYVRCGRCVSVFNALVSLADEADLAAEARVEDKAAATQSRPAPLAEDLMALDGADPEQLPEVTDDSHEMGTGTFETIVLEGDAILQTEEFVDENEVDEQLKALAEQFEGHEPADNGDPAEKEIGVLELLEAATPRRAPDFGPAPDAAEAGPEATPDAPAEATADGAAPGSRATLDDLLPDHPDSRGRKWPWITAVAALALLLGLQAVHHWRVPLAARLPALGSLYAALGKPLPPSWELSAYDVRQLGATADPTDADHIEVRASVRNAARQPQPAPLLRVVLQDRYGNELSRQELAPSQYLRGTSMTMLDADQRVDASLRVDDPGQKAVGFELDACLPTAGGAVRCAGDPAPAQ